MNEYSEKIIFKKNNRKSTGGTWKAITMLLGLLVFCITIIASCFYVIENRPTSISDVEIIDLITNSDVVKKNLIDETQELFGKDFSYINGVYSTGKDDSKYGEIYIDVGYQLNSSATYVYGVGKVKLKYKRGWKIVDITKIKNSQLLTLFSAGESFKHQLSNEIYGSGVFKYNGSDYKFTRNYVDSLVVIKEEGDLSSTKLSMAPFNTEGRVEMEATMTFDKEIEGWKLIDWKFIGGR
ncbi:MAG: hypothetical protein ACRDA5_09670 [Clostridium sp.]